MTKARGSRQTVPLEEVVLAQAFQLEAMLNVLEQKGVIRKAEVLEASGGSFENADSAPAPSRNSRGLVKSEDEYPIGDKDKGVVERRDEEGHEPKVQEERVKWVISYCRTAMQCEVRLRPITC